MRLSEAKAIADNRCANGQHDIGMGLSAVLYAERGTTIQSNSMMQYGPVRVERAFVTRRCRNCGAKAS